MQGVEGSRLILSGVDLVCGTPILDVKPYIPAYDLPCYVLPHKHTTPAAPGVPYALRHVANGSGSSGRDDATLVAASASETTDMQTERGRHACAAGGMDETEEEVAAAVSARLALPPHVKVCCVIQVPAWSQPSEATTVRVRIRDEALQQLAELEKSGAKLGCIQKWQSVPVAIEEVLSADPR
jgi:hypothetical protein